LNDVCSGEGERGDGTWLQNFSCSHMVSPRFSYGTRSSATAEIARVGGHSDQIRIGGGLRSPNALVGHILFHSVRGRGV